MYTIITFAMEIVWKYVIIQQLFVQQVRKERLNNRSNMNSWIQQQRGERENDSTCNGAEKSKFCVCHCRAQDEGQRKVTTSKPDYCAIQQPGMKHNSVVEPEAGHISSVNTPHAAEKIDIQGNGTGGKFSGGRRRVIPTSSQPGNCVGIPGYCSDNSYTQLHQNDSNNANYEDTLQATERGKAPARLSLPRNPNGDKHEEYSDLNANSQERIRLNVYITLSKKDGEKRNQMQQQKKLVHMLFVVFIVIVVCWCPIAVNFMIDKGGQFPSIAYVSFMILAWSNSAVNIFIYGGMSNKFRNAYKNLFRLMLRQPNSMS